MAGMKNLKKRRRIQIIVIAIIAMAISVGLMGYAFKDGINFFRSPTQVYEDPPRTDEVFRLGGLVVEGSLLRGEGTQIAFTVTDGNAEVNVTYEGVLPDLFEENQGMVGTGTLTDGVFVATEILAKHDETYMPAELTEALKAQGIW